MKKIFIMLIMLIVVLYPLETNAKTLSYLEAQSYAEKYIKNFKNYEFYITHKDSQNLFEFINGVSSFNSNFRIGGFLNKQEYGISGGKNSYLFDGQNYWTMTESNQSAYIVDVSDENTISLKNKTDDYYSRITEFIRNGVKVTGTGSYANPWVFVEVKPSYVIAINITDENNVINTDLPKSYVKKFEENLDEILEIASNKTATGAMVSCTTAESNGKISITPINTGVVGGKVRVQLNEITEDTICTIKTNPRKYNVKFTSVTGGSIDPNGVREVIHGNNLEYTITPNTGYTTAGATCTCGTSCSISVNKMTVTNVKADALTCSLTLKPSIFTVTFNVNGGTAFNATTCPSSSFTRSGTNCSKKVTSGTAYGTLPTPKHSNVCNDFMGWYTAATGGTQVTLSSIFSLSSNQTLYARWVKNDSNGTWGICNNFTSMSGNYANGTRRNSCEKIEECRAYCSFTGYTYSSISCGTQKAKYDCEGGTTYEQSTGYSKPCISKPTGCTITLSPSSFKYGVARNDVTFYGTATGTTYIDSCSFSGLKRNEGCNPSGTNANPLGYTIGVWCEGINSSKKTTCSWYGSNIIGLTVQNSAGSASCSKSYSVN